MKRSMCFAWSRALQRTGDGRTLPGRLRCPSSTALESHPVGEPAIAFVECAWGRTPSGRLRVPSLKAPANAIATRESRSLGAWGPAESQPRSKQRSLAANSRRLGACSAAAPKHWSRTPSGRLRLLLWNARGVAARRGACDCLRLPSSYVHGFAPRRGACECHRRITKPGSLGAS